MYRNVAIGLALASVGLAQNVGIGIATPAAKLEVYDHDPANVNVGGRVRVSADGAPGRRTYVEFAPWRSRPGGPPSQIIGVDDGNASAHIGFWTAPPGGGGTSTPLERMRIQSDGEIFGRFRHVSYHKFHNATYSGNPAQTIDWLPSPGGDATDD